MAKIRFQDGTEIEVQGSPSPQEVERLYAQAKRGSVEATVGGRNIPILSGLAKIGTGLASEVSKIPFGIAQLGARAVGAKGLAERIGSAREAIYEKPFEQNILNTGAGKVGQVGGTIASFVAPSGAITKGQRALTGVASRLTQGAPRAVQGAARLGSRAAVEGVSDFGVELARTGGDFEQAQKAGVGGAAFSGALGSLGSAYRRAFSPNLQKSAVRALGLTGKQTAGSAETAGIRFAQGLETLAERGKGVKVLDDTGVEKAFEPTKASFPETLQAFNKTKSNIYNEYSKLAQQTGDDLIDVSDVWVQLDELSKRPNLGQTRNAIRQLMDDMDLNFPSGYGTAANLQNFLEELNRVSVSQFAGTGDKALGRVAISVGDILRERLDETISTATGGRYSDLRQAYGSLKSIESELVNQFKKQSRRLGGGLQDYMQIVNSGDLVGALIAADPKVLAASGVRAFLTQLRTSLNDPERYLRRAFNLIENDKPSRVLRERIFGGNIDNTQEFQRGFQEADEAINRATTEGQAGFIDPMGMSKSSFNPSGTTKTTNLLEEARKYDSAEEFVEKEIDNYVKNTKDFKDWSKGSKNIIEAYHGTPYSFDEFKIGEKQTGAYELDSLSFATDKANAEPFSRQYPDSFFPAREKLKSKFEGIDNLLEKKKNADAFSKMRSENAIIKDGREIVADIQKRLDKRKELVESFGRNFGPQDMEKFREEEKYLFQEKEKLENELRRVRNTEPVQLTRLEKKKIQEYQKELKELEDSFQGNVYKVYIKGNKVIDEVGENIGFGSERNEIAANLDGGILRIKDADTGQYIGDEIIVNDPSQVFIVNSPKNRSQLEDIWKQANQ